MVAALVLLARLFRRSGPCCLWFGSGSSGRYGNAFAALDHSLLRAPFGDAFAVYIFKPVSLAGHHHLAVAQSGSARRQFAAEAIVGVGLDAGATVGGVVVGRHKAETGRADAGPVRDGPAAADNSDGGASATQVPLAVSRWDAGAGSRGAATGSATHRPLRISCQGKHCRSEDESSFACARAGSELKRTKEMAIAAPAKKRVMTNPSPIPLKVCGAK